MGYTEDDSMVRVDFFKESGKWYTTEAIKWIGYDGNILIHDAFSLSLFYHLYENNKLRLFEMQAICLEPYHSHSHPISKMVKTIPLSLLNVFNMPNKQFYVKMPQYFRDALESKKNQIMEATNGRYNTN